MDKFISKYVFILFYSFTARERATCTKVVAFTDSSNDYGTASHTQLLPIDSSNPHCYTQ